uniref:Uncharacterized protein n=1 Tax=Moniliophthora roreri TaxID=221103 RepID=A0A0W0EUB5_MONRR
MSFLPTTTNQLQAPIKLQLAITLYCLEHYGNSADVWGVACMFGCSEGLVAKATDRCFEAIDALHDLFVQPLTEEEKEIEKQWMRDQLGMERNLWCESYMMYDGTIVVLYHQPSHQGQGYYTRKANYGLNVQVRLF